MKFALIIPKYITSCVKILIKFNHVLILGGGGFLEHAYAGFAKGGGSNLCCDGASCTRLVGGSRTCPPSGILVK